MTLKEIISGLMLELRRGSITILVLSQLNQPTYGYKLVKTLDKNRISIEGNTLYPLMRRLETLGWFFYNRASNYCFCNFRKIII